MKLFCQVLSAVEGNIVSVALFVYREKSGA